MLFGSYDDSAQAENEREQEARERGREDEIEGAFIAGLRRAQELANGLVIKTASGALRIVPSALNQAIDAEAGKERDK